MNEQNKLFYPLNGYEMQLLNPDALLITYDKLNNINDIKELFKNHDKIIILYLLDSRNTGHWCTLYINYKDKSINFFDSYGKNADYWINKLSDSELREYRQKRNRIDDLLNDYLVYYNNIELQQPKTQTCGCFVTHRLHNSNMNEKNYIDKYFKSSKKSPDEIVANYCLKLLKKK